VSNLNILFHQSASFVFLLQILTDGCSGSIQVTILKIVQIVQSCDSMLNFISPFLDQISTILSLYLLTYLFTYLLTYLITYLLTYVLTYLLTCLLT
jgi:hypothetical protein